MLNIASNELGQQSWHFNNGAARNENYYNNQRVNTCIEDTRWQHTKDLFSHKRFSLNLEGPSDHYPSMILDFPELRTNTAMNSNHLNQNVVSQKNKKKRRLSNLGCLTSSFFEDYAKAVRRGSMASASSFAASNRGSSKCGSDDDSVISQMSDGIPFDMTTPLRFQMNTRKNLSNLNLKETMEMFYDSMSMSQKSQLAIHDWDKKMGLKRSHSKTMRLSMRSRKKLKAMIKKDIVHVSHNR